MHIQIHLSAWIYVWKLLICIIKDTHKKRLFIIRDINNKSLLSITRDSFSFDMDDKTLLQTCAYAYIVNMYVFWFCATTVQQWKHRVGKMNESTCNSLQHTATMEARNREHERIHVQHTATHCKTQQQWKHGVGKLK